MGMVGIGLTIAVWHQLITLAAESIMFSALKLHSSILANPSRKRELPVDLDRHTDFQWSRRQEVFCLLLQLHL